MAERRPTGKLAVILHADVAGSTDLVRQDEQLAHDRIQETFRRFDDTITKYHGSVRELRGDALLAEFERASDAVTAALAFQDNQLEFLANFKDTIQPMVRVGIAMGEVIIADDTITGEGVVLAQRLEQLAKPGAVVIQGAAYETIPGRFPFKYDYFGEHGVKGFDQPVRVYQAKLKSGTDLPQPSPTVHNTRNTIIAVASVTVIVIGIALLWFKPWEPRVEPASVERMAFPLPDKPSIAVLPFDNLSGDANQEYFADGITNDIITDLSKFKNLFVIASNSTFSYKDKAIKVQQVAEELGVRYVLEGSIQRTDDKLRINAQLIDAIKGNHLWAERYDRDAGDFFAIQEDIVRTIVASLAFQVHREEIERAVRADTDSLKAYDYYQRGWEAYFSFTKEANIQAREYFEKAIELDPNYARAYAFLTWTHVNDSPGRWGWGDDPEHSLNLALEVAHKAVELDPEDYYSYWALGFAHLYHRDYDRALAEYERALTLNPNDSDLLVEMVDLLISIGRAEQAVTQSKMAMRINPRPQDWMIYYLGYAQYFAKQYEEALVTLKKMSNPPNHSRQVLSAVLVRLGRVEEAQAVMSKYIETNLEVTLEEMKDGTWNHQEYLDRYMSDLRTAGLLETRPLPLPDKPSIAVLPFTNMSDDSEQEYFADGMTDDLITDLSKISGLFVIARDSSFAFKGQQSNVVQVAKELGVRYVLQGSVRKSGERVRINTQLIDSNTGGNAWAERYESSMTDVFLLQDEVTNKIITALAVKLTGSEQRDLALMPTESLEAYDSFLRAERSLFSQSSEELAAALSHYRKATEIDPNFARAWAGHARAAVDILRFDWFDVMPGHHARKQAYESASRALLLDPNDARAYSVLAILQMVESRHEESIESARKAVALSPSDADALLNLALVLSYAGEHDEAIRTMKAALKLNPKPPSGFYRLTGFIQFMSRNYEEAENLLIKARSVSSPDPSHEEMAMIYAQMGKTNQANAEVDGMLTLWPEANLTYYRVLYSHHKRQEDLDFRINALRKAGLPQWPYGYEGRKEDRLTHKEIEHLLFDQIWVGFRVGAEEFIRENNKDGVVGFRDPRAHPGRSRSAYMLSGTATIDGNKLCYQYEEFLLGRKYCGYVFRNSKGSHREKNAYVDINAIAVDYFTAGPE